MVVVLLLPPFLTMVNGEFKHGGGNCGGVVGRLDMYRTKVLLYRTMVLLVRPTKVRR